jgi:MoxR-like ATPase
VNPMNPPNPSPRRPPAGPPPANGGAPNGGSGAAASAPGGVDERHVSWFAERFAAVAANCAKVLQGKPEVIRLALTGLFAEGHLLIEDVPGVGKTSLARALAASLQASSHRIQFTPDLLPSDITGVTVFNQGANEFEFRPGGVFANVVVADEINRASPKTQSALLEVMEERAVTVDSHRHPVPRPFIVVATQNPIDLEGTYRLPEAQLDRFLLRLSVGYPDRSSEVAIALEQSVAPAIDELGPVCDTPTVLTMIDIARHVYLAPALAGYAVDLTEATRTRPEVRIGISPRGTVALVRAARSHAAASGRPFVVPEDVKAVAGPVLAHRLLLTPDAELRRIDPRQLIDRLLDELPLPATAGAPAR